MKTKNRICFDVVLALISSVFLCSTKIVFRVKTMTSQVYPDVVAQTFITLDCSQLLTYLSQDSSFYCENSDVTFSSKNLFKE